MWANDDVSESDEDENFLEETFPLHHPVERSSVSTPFARRRNLIFKR